MAKFFDIKLTPNPLPFMNVMGRIMPIVEKVIGTSMTASILNRLKEGTPVDSGDAKKAWASDVVPGGITFSNPVIDNTDKNPTYYANILEEGLYHRSQPTEKVDRGSRRPGWFSTQALDGIIQPLIDDKDFVDYIAEMCMDKYVAEVTKRA